MIHPLLVIAFNHLSQETKEKVCDRLAEIKIPQQFFLNHPERIPFFFDEEYVLCLIDRENGKEVYLLPKKSQT